MTRIGTIRNKIKNLTIQDIAGLNAIFIPLISIIAYLISNIATESQVAKLNNKLSINDNDIKISLMYIKWKDTKLESWPLEAQAKYKVLLKEQELLEAKRKELDGIPKGLPE